MTKKMQGRKSALNRTDRNESQTFCKTAADSPAGDQRKEVREQVIGDVIWSYAADQEENYFKGTVINESESGLSILTLSPIKVGSVLRIFGEGRTALRDATVIWCKKGSANIYKSGLFLTEKS